MKLLACLSCFILAACHFFPGHAGVLAVGAGQQYQSLKDAIANAGDFDTVIVKPGDYSEHSIIVNKPLTILGEQRPRIEPGAEKVEVFVVAADSVVIEGFEIANVAVSFLKELAAIKVRSGKHGVIRNNLITNCFFGIYLEYGKDCLIEGNRIIGQATDEARAGNAIHVWKGDRIEIAHNIATGHRDGIYLEFVNNSTIHNNRSYDNIRYGLHFMFSNDDAYLDNAFGRNGAGVAVMFSRNIRMVGNCFSENWGGASYGLLLKEINTGEIRDNVFRKNTTGIVAEGASRLLIEGNQFTSNGTALDIKGNCLENRIVKNNFLANSFEVVTNSRYNLNEYDHNYWSKYRGYDLDRDGIGDEPYRPVDLFSKITNEIPSATIMMHSFVVNLMDLSERLFPQIIPEELVDTHPRMKPFTHASDCISQ